MKWIRLAVFLLLLWFVNSAPAYAGTFAQFRTVFGNIDIELYDQDKPVTVQNFIRYVESGRFNNGFAHRLVPGFIIQGGGFAITNGGTTNWGTTAIMTDPPIVNEFGVGKRYTNVYGTLAMAKQSGKTNSATSQWFFNLANNHSLDAEDSTNMFVVFGHVLSGTNVLNAFNGFQYWTGVQSSNLVLHQFYSAPFDDLPLLRPSIEDTNLLGVAISLLRAQIAMRTDGAREISWNSVSNRVNTVEFATNFASAWQLLTATNGTGGMLQTIDPAPSDPRRFYRVRVVIDEGQVNQRRVVEDGSLSTD